VIETDDELAYYPSPGPLTTLPADAGKLPSEPDGVRKLVPALLVHTAWLAHYGLEVPPLDARQTEGRRKERVPSA
jgi:hypothetical protein